MRFKILIIASVLLFACSTEDVNFTSIKVEEKTPVNIYNEEHNKFKMEYYSSLDTHTFSIAYRWVRKDKFPYSIFLKFTDSSSVLINTSNKITENMGFQVSDRTNIDTFSYGLANLTFVDKYRNLTHKFIYSIGKEFIITGSGKGYSLINFDKIHLQNANSNNQYTGKINCSIGIPAL